MSTTSMSLKTLQFLLQHMDANRRFEIYNRCPSLREFEKSVPLKINSLVLNGRSVIVNDTTYKLGIIRKYTVGETPQYVTDSNEIGGLTHEVDRFGIKDVLDKYTVTPGDVGINLPRRPIVDSEEGQIRYRENQIQHYEGQIAEERGRGYVRNRSIVDHWELIIEVSRAKLFDYHCRRENIPPNFEHYLQLTTSRAVDGQEQRTIQRYAHNRKYSEAMKQLTTVLLGGRNSPISVTKIKFICPLGVIRLPFGVKFRVEQLMCQGHASKTLEALAPILHESSYPLKKLAIGVFPLNDINNPIIRTAGILRIRSSDISQHLRLITNPILHITLSELSERTPLAKLMADCVESRRPVGTEFIILFHLEPYFANEMEDILKSLNGVPIDDENVIIPLSDTAQLRISYGPFPEFAPRSKWAVRFSTEAIEHS
ncbi:unnamed protein product [Caenorhabditis brenneri]